MGHQVALPGEPNIINGGVDAQDCRAFLSEAEIPIWARGKGNIIRVTGGFPQVGTVGIGVKGRSAG